MVTAPLYSIDDIAVLARVSKVVVIKLCLSGLMPEWREIDGGRYWNRSAATEAVALLIRMNVQTDTAKLELEGGE